MTLSKEAKLQLFGEGEWIDEPDFLIYQYRGYTCLVVRKEMGHLCGYVVIPRNHWAFEKDYDDLNEIDCHGGLTFSDKITQFTSFFLNSKDSFECDWAIGFDCGHSHDITPRMYKDFPKIYKNRFFIETTYKNIDFVKKELESIVDQLEKNHDL